MEQILSYVTAYGTLVIAHAPQLIGVVLPPLIQVLNKDIPDSRMRFFMAAITCFVAAVILNWNKITLGTPDAAFIATGVIFLESETVYRLYFKNSILQTKMNNLLNRSAGEKVVPQ